jgi:hypothetical protein
MRRHFGVAYAGYFAFTAELSFVVVMRVRQLHDCQPFMKRHLVCMSCNEGDENEKSCITPDRFADDARSLVLFQ